MAGDREWNTSRLLFLVALLVFGVAALAATGAWAPAAPLALVAIGLGLVAAAHLV